MVNGNDMVNLIVKKSDLWLSKTALREQLSKNAVAGKVL